MSCRWNWVQVMKNSPFVGKWNCRILSGPANVLAEGNDNEVETSQSSPPNNFPSKPATSQHKKGNNWSYTAELSALAVRLGHKVEDVPSLVAAFQQREVQPRAASKVTGIKQTVVRPNRLSVLGRSVMMHYVNEYLYFSYPVMDGSMLVDLATSITNQDALVKLANHYGVSDLIKTRSKFSSSPCMQVISHSFCAVIGAIYQDQGPKSAKKLLHELVIAQLAGKDLEEVVKLQHPRFMLNAILTSQRRPKAVSRLIGESGRATHFPSFVVGIFSGETCWGEGTGTSLRRAEQEAMLTSLRTHFQKELSACPLPSDDEEFATEWELKDKVVTMASPHPN